MSDFVISKNQNWFSKLCWFWGYQNFGPIPWEFDFGILHEFLKMRRWRWYAWANPYQNLRKCIELYLQQVELIKLSSLFDFSSTNAISAHVKSIFCVVFDIVESRECHRHQKMWNLLAHLLIYVKTLSDDVHLPKHPRKCYKVDFWDSVPRKLVRVWYHWKWFFKLYNLSYSDLSFIRWIQKS